MKFTFKARIYKVGINLVVEVPHRITKTMQPKKGYIPVNGTIENHPFQQTLCPVKDSPYRLYVNGLMLKGSGMGLGKTAKFVIEQNLSEKPRKDSVVTPAFKRRLTSAGVWKTFNELTPSRQKEIVRYLHYLKSEEAKERNLTKVIETLRSQAVSGTVVPAQIRTQKSKARKTR
ncbi:MAG TPA: YdeI/OmpD-associated family protein [Cyclobacteriaceae bacterium]|nr:YdeI/OmpD-associated family protein [Cyclobacteriaceae bacterium]HMV08849.1 YdeI/OmpD-associated family protein [Cyclobacteriaceae bacterium]HMV91210.1 YdeI/OmpD-associated family protein [Cyclobacteriaceae bacterium]HMW99995.1 YdeI/OmpD-associated family protein [Cyclobacteriaceae bacterium]HMX49142.1 YdeI/OmpD-associated family protein [Cyclobacteriaceae bacterium]